ncbi:MAG: preprotein translocase subunit SecY [Thermoprotei archaeon]|nr:MAG: preprotein translocase subunit SecY [Thermoprotei archaeon]
MGLLELFAAIGRYLPSTPKPKRKVSLSRRLVYTGIAVGIFVALASTPLYGIEKAGLGLGPFSPFLAIVFAMQQGTLAQLGIGPIVDAGIILQILVGAKFLDLDLTDPEDRRLFTLAEKGLAMVIAIIMALGYVITNRIFWPITTPPLWVRVVVLLQLIWGFILILFMDEAIQKGWGIGSGISLFILTGVARRVFTDIFSPFTVPVGDVQEPVGFIPYVIQRSLKGEPLLEDMLIRFREPLRMTMPNLIGFVTTITLIGVLAYLQAAKIYVPITSSRYHGIRSRVPLQLLYVSNIPVLLSSILFSNIAVFSSILAANPSFSGIASTLNHYFRTPPNLFTLMYDPGKFVVYTITFFAFSILFGFAWVEIGGLSPEVQAEQLVKSGLEIPGMRRNPKILTQYLARYIYPLALLSTLIVVVIALIGDIFFTYGSGVGLLLGVGIVYNYYRILAYEQTLEMYPTLKRFLGE